MRRWLPWLTLLLLCCASCTSPKLSASALPTAAGPGAAPATATPAQPVPVPSATLMPNAQSPAGATEEALAVTLLYPKADTAVPMGEAAHFIVQVKNQQGGAVDSAQVSVALAGPHGELATTLVAQPAGGDAYRASWPVPHRIAEGTWRVTAAAKVADTEGQATGSFKIVNSTSETLLQKYGFWLEAPGLISTTPTIYDQRGDAANGMIRWGGFAPNQHIQPENWIDVEWRQGDFHLDNADAVRRFMLEQIGNLGFRPIRSLGPFERTRFKNWDAWRIGGRGFVERDQVQWMAFYAPEVDKTYVLGTLAVDPPKGIDPHAALRASFAVDPNVHAAGVAPDPLPHLLPPPELLSPPLGAQFQGTTDPIVLRWQGASPSLTADEYYEVAVDYNYGEANPAVSYATRDTQFTLPVDLYHSPNCHVFNWQVRLMRKTGVDQSGQLHGEPLSYPSLYWYVYWAYPADQPEPFLPNCKNAQF